MENTMLILALPALIGFIRAGYKQDQRDDEQLQYPQSLGMGSIGENMQQSFCATAAAGRN